MESRNMVLIDLFAGQEERCRHRKWTCEHSGGVEGNGGTNRESSIDVYTLSRIK